MTTADISIPNVFEQIVDDIGAGLDQLDELVDTSRSLAAAEDDPTDETPDSIHAAASNALASQIGQIFAQIANRAHAGAVVASAVEQDTREAAEGATEELSSMFLEAFGALLNDNDDEPTADPDTASSTTTKWGETADGSEISLRAGVFEDATEVYIGGNLSGVIADHGGLKTVTGGADDVTLLGRDLDEDLDDSVRRIVEAHPTSA